MHKIKCLLVLTGLILSPAAWADLDPELAEVSTKNDGGVYLGFGLNVGQSYATGGSKPGVAYFASVEPGYVAKRDSWGRIETSLELATGQLAFRRKNETKDNAKVNLGLLALAKIGYGKSLGYNTFGVFKVGAGPVMATYKADVGGVDVKSDGTISGFAAQFGYEVIMIQSESFDFVAAFKHTYISMDIDDVKVEGVTFSVDEPLNMNVPTLMLGARLSF